MKCAAVPKAVPAATIQAAGSSGRGAARLTTAGREPNATAYGSHDHAVAFRPRL
jgi:guanyl-specific ribonuclease Sa